MSVRWMARVWDLEGLDSIDTLVMLALGDNASDDPGRDGLCWPSLATIARKARCHENTARRRLQALAKRGYLRIEEKAGQSNRYWMQWTPTTPEPSVSNGSDPLEGPDPYTQEVPLPPGGTPTGEVPLPPSGGGGDADQGAPLPPSGTPTPTTQVVPEPSVEPSVTTSSSPPPTRRLEWYPSKPIAEEGKDLYPKADARSVTVAYIAWAKGKKSAMNDANWLTFMKNEHERILRIEREEAEAKAQPRRWYGVAGDE